jgi:hypothetical protein
VKTVIRFKSKVRDQKMGRMMLDFRPCAFEIAAENRGDTSFETRRAQFSTNPSVWFDDQDRASCAWHAGTVGAPAVRAIERIVHYPSIRAASIRRIIVQLERCFAVDVNADVARGHVQGRADASAARLCGRNSGNSKS